MSETHKRFNPYPALKISIRIETGQLLEFVEEFSDSLAHKQTKLENMWELLLTETNEEAIQSQSAFLEDLGDKYFRLLPRLTYNTLLPTLYSYFENRLVRLCDYEAECCNSEFRVLDIEGKDYIVRSHKYLELLLKVDFKSGKEQLKKITKVQELRNLIAHKGAVIQTSKKDIFRYIEQNESIQLDDYNITGIKTFHISDKKFLLETLSLFADYLNFMVDKIVEKRGHS